MLDSKSKRNGSITKMELGEDTTSDDGSASSAWGQPLDVGAPSPDTSKEAESSDRPRNERVGANENKKSLVLRHPRHLYRFSNVGAVFAFSRVGALHITAETEKGNMPVDIPSGNWLIVGVGAMDCLDISGFVTYDDLGNSAVEVVDPALPLPTPSASH